MYGLAETSYTLGGASATLDAQLVQGINREAVRPEAEYERRLVERAGLGDGQAFGQLYQRYVDDVYAYVHLRVREDAVAEDLTQDIFISAFRALPRFEWQGSFSPWLLRCAHNRVVNYWRALGRQPEWVPLPGEAEEAEEYTGPELADDQAAPMDEAIELQMSTAAIQTAMSELTDLQQQVVALRFGAGLTLSETAEMMSRSQNAIKNLQHNALIRLRRVLVTVEVAE